MYYHHHLETPHILFHHTVSGEATPDFALHCHAEYEIYFYIRGDVSYLVEGQAYPLEPHSMLLLAPGTFHGVRIDSDAPYERYCLHFDAALPAPRTLPLLNSIFQSHIYYRNAERLQLSAFFEAVEACRQLEPPVREEVLGTRAEALTYQLLMLSGDSPGVGSLNSEQEGPLVRRLLSYLNLHLTEDLSLDGLAERFYISKHHLNKIIKRSTSTTVMDYVIHKRVAMARQLIREGLPAAAAAEQSGFHDYSAFYRACRRVTGATPSSFNQPPEMR